MVKCSHCDSEAKRVKAKAPGSSKTTWVCEVCRGPWKPVK